MSLLSYFLLFFVSSISAASVCRDNDIYYDKNCYMIVHKQYLYKEAVNYCKNQNARIITIHSQAQNDFLQQTGLNNLTETTFMWIGLTFVGDKYQWEDGTKLDYTNWQEGVPSFYTNDVLAMLPRYPPVVKGWTNYHEFQDAAQFICMYPQNTPAPAVKPSTAAPNIPAGTRPPKPATVTCKPNYRQFDGSCYFFSNTENLYIDSQQHCENDGANLVSIHYKEEEDFVNKGANTNPIWIGLHLDNGKYQWVDGTPVDFLNWGPTYPRGQADRVALFGFGDGTNYWTDSYRGEMFYYVCKYTPSSKPVKNHCDPTDLNIGKRCYAFNAQKMTYDNARSSCESIGKTLAVFDNAAQINYVTSTATVRFATNFGTYFIGLHKNEKTGQFEWPGSVPLTFSYWTPGYPAQGQSIVAGSLSNGKWMTDDAAAMKPFVCSGVLP